MNPNDNRDLTTECAAGTGLWANTGRYWPWFVLLVVTGMVYAPVVNYPFLRWDDNGYVTENPLVLGGLSVPSVKIAFTSYQFYNYHPLTMLSLMLDATLFGKWAGGYHLTSVLLHIGNVWLLFSLLQRLTGSRSASFWVSLLFAIHPQHVESVAWISGRKDVLSIFFGLLAIRSYLRYTEERRWISYVLLIVFHAMSLLSKPTLVTLPCVLLLLDAWPLRRGRVVEEMSRDREGAVVSGAPLPHGRGSATSSQPLSGNSLNPLRDKTQSWAVLFWEKCPLFLLSGLLSVSWRKRSVRP